MTCDKKSCCTVGVRFTALLVAWFALACGDSGGDSGSGGSSIDLDGGIRGCVAPTVPADQPSMPREPRFEQELLRPGTDIIVEVDVNGETESVRIELTNVHDRDATPIGVAEELTPGGDTTLVLTFPTELTVLGRFFLHVTLCGRDCATRRVIYTLAPEPDERTGDPSELPINQPYQRIVFEGTEEVSDEKTCVDLESVVVQ